MCITTKKTGYRPMRVCVVCGARVSSVSTPKTQDKESSRIPSQSPREPQLVTMVSITPVQFAKTKATSYCDPEYQGRPWGV